MPTHRHGLTRRAALTAAPAFTLAIASRSPAAGLTADDFVARLPERLQGGGVPGVSWALIERGELRHLGAWGFANLATRQPLRADTLLGTASVTKTFTATLLMQQVEQGRCGLDEPAARHLPFALRHPTHPEVPLTLRHLLTHSSGLADPSAAYAASYACGDPAQGLEAWLREALYGEAAQVQPPFHADAPGQRHAYSNVGYGLLGLVLQQLTGRPYAQLLREDLLQPLGMTRSRVLLGDLSPEAQARELATPYEPLAPGKALAPPVDRLAQGAPMPFADGQHQALCPYSFATVSDGLLRSSAAEMARFALALLQGGELEGRRILRAPTLAQMWSDQLAALPATQRPRYHQGLAWRGLGDANAASPAPTPAPARYWAHFGSDPGTAAALTVRPQDGRGLVMLSNGARARPLLGRLSVEWMAAGR
ncbi:serine hydrolase domain-containing protein [Inhella sp.]|uniref:serine hydrolase domain-containing protein n=1 Tax=Inhella sp. TaxID=1921806 RepID=UPI0035B12EE1